MPLEIDGMHLILDFEVPNVDSAGASRSANRQLLDTPRSRLAREASCPREFSRPSPVLLPCVRRAVLIAQRMSLGKVCPHSDGEIRALRGDELFWQRAGRGCRCPVLALRISHLADHLRSGIVHQEEELVRRVDVVRE